MVRIVNGSLDAWDRSNFIDADSSRGLTDLIVKWRENSRETVLEDVGGRSRTLEDVGGWSIIVAKRFDASTWFYLGQPTLDVVPDDTPRSCPGRKRVSRWKREMMDEEDEIGDDWYEITFVTRARRRSRLIIPTSPPREDVLSSLRQSEIQISRAAGGSGDWRKSESGKWKSNVNW